MKRKGIILAGGNGTRLSPLTISVSKQLLPIYDKPLIYYPLSTLILSGIKEILIITKEFDLLLFKKLFGDGSHLGIEISYAVQNVPRGIAEAFIIGEEFLDNSPSALILGDNLFYGYNLTSQIIKAGLRKKGGTIFLYPVKERERYGIATLDSNSNIQKIEEKPKKPKSNLAVTGLYLYDESVVERAKKIKPSARGELEISCINNSYLNDGLLFSENLGRGMAWLDTGSFDSLDSAGSFVRAIESRQGLKIGCPEEAAWRKGFINNKELIKISKNANNSEYSNYLMSLVSNI